MSDVVGNLVKLTLKGSTINESVNMTKTFNTLHSFKIGPQKCSYQAN